jgi:hypothetical protein
MSVMLTKFESKSNRVKGEFQEDMNEVAIKLTSWPQGLRFIRHNLFLRRRYIMEAYNFGIIAWACWWIDLRSMKVRLTGG